MKHINLILDLQFIDSLLLATLTPCGGVDNKTFVKKKNGYYFIGKYK